MARMKMNTRMSMITRREMGSANEAAMLPVHSAQYRVPLASVLVMAPSTHKAQYGPW